MKLATIMLIGIVAGLIGALCGVGGGIVIVPALVKILGFEQKQAVATSMAIIIVIASAATLNHHRGSGLIDWKVVLLVGVGAALASWFGSDLMRAMGNPVLTRLFGVVLLVFGVRMLWRG